jgi:hypothetical protein
MSARVAPDGTSGPQQTVAAPLAAPGAYETIQNELSLAANGNGDAVGSWYHAYDPPDGSARRYRIRAAILDTTPPVISALQISGQPVVGRPLTMSVATTDALSGATAVWDFGDGTTEEGEAVTKTYSAAGDYMVRVTVTDDAGNVTTKLKFVAVSERRPPL